MLSKASDLATTVQDLISMPEVCFQVYNIANDPLCSAVEMASAIGQDPGLAVNVLKVANSPYYGFPSRVDTITRAIAVIGTQDLRELVLATSIVGAFSSLSEDVIDLRAFWHHSLLTGLVARRLGSKAITPVLRRERLFVAGLLHTMGHLVMATVDPDRYQKMQEEARNPGVSMSSLEWKYFDCKHTEVAYELMTAWRLPEMLRDAALNYLYPENSDDYQLETSITHVASHFVAAELDLHEPAAADRVSTIAWKVTGLTPELVSEALGSSITEYADVASAFLVNVRTG